MTSLLLAALLGTAQADEKQAEDCVHTKVWDSYGDGWGVRTMTSTTLEQGKTRNFLVTLYAGNEYKITSCGDSNVANLDILLYDTEGTLLSRDSSEDRQPGFAFKPEQTATYYVVLYLRELKDAKADAGVAMAVIYK